jgi:hypothetical protein
VRAIHRDLGYVAVGLTFVYAISGLAVNHVADWDSNFENLTRTYDVSTRDSRGDDDIVNAVLAHEGIVARPTEIYREGDDLEILLDHRTLHVTSPRGSTTAHVLDEAQKPRFFLRAANWLHLNRGKRAWKYFADAYAAGLLLLATSGLFMIAGKKGLIGRGAIFVAIGVAIPVLYITLSHGP